MNITNKNGRSLVEPTAVLSPPSIRSSAPTPDFHGDEHTQQRRAANDRRAKRNSGDSATNDRSRKWLRHRSRSDADIVNLQSTYQRVLKPYGIERRAAGADEVQVCERLAGILPQKCPV